MTQLFQRLGVGHTSSPGLKRPSQGVFTFQIIFCSMMQSVHNSHSLPSRTNLLSTSRSSRCQIKPFQQQRNHIVLRKRQVLLRAQGNCTLFRARQQKSLDHSQHSSLNIKMFAEEDGFQDKIKRLKDQQKKEDKPDEGKDKKGEGLSILHTLRSCNSFEFNTASDLTALLLHLLTKEGDFPFNTQRALRREQRRRKWITISLAKHSTLNRLPIEATWQQMWRLGLPYSGYPLLLQQSEEQPL